MTEGKGPEPTRPAAAGSPLPFQAFPVRPRRPVLGALLIGASTLFPILLLVLPYVLAAYALDAPGVVSAIRSNFALSAISYIVLSVLGVAAFLGLRYLFATGAALRQSDAIELLKNDPRDPVLYLRSFDDDAVPDLTGSVPLLGPKRTVEMRLSKALEGLGPVVSIGRPGERLPEVGANRFYVSDADWKRAVEYFLERAAAVVILVGRSTGVTWEIETALSSVPRRKLLFVFPYLLPKEERTRKRALKEALRLRGRGDDSVSKTMLADLREEREARYRSFRERFDEDFSPDLPSRLDGAVFIDFVADGRARRIPTRQPLFIRRRRDRQGLTLDYRRTLRPFLEKLQGRTIDADRVERFFTNRFTLGAFTATCILVALVCFFGFPFWFSLGAPGVLFFFLLFVAANLAYWGVWNLLRPSSGT